MTAVEARRLVADGEGARLLERERLAAEARLQAAAEALRRRDRILKETAQLTGRLQEAIAARSRDGYYHDRKRLPDATGDLNGEERAAATATVATLLADGFQAHISEETLATGVDEWRCEYYLCINWKHEPLPAGVQSRVGREPTTTAVAAVISIAAEQQMNDHLEQVQHRMRHLFGTGRV